MGYVCDLLTFQVFRAVPCLGSLYRAIGLFWNSITKGAAVVKKRSPIPEEVSKGSSQSRVLQYSLPDFSVTLNLNSPLKRIRR